MKNLLAMTMITITIHSMEYVPKGAQRIPPTNCIFRAEGVQGLYQTPAGFMVKLAKNKWRKAPIIDHKDLLPFSSTVQGFIEMDGLFLVLPAQHGMVCVKTYWPYDHLKHLTTSIVQSLFDSYHTDDNKEPENE